MNELHHHQSTNQITESPILPTYLTQPDNIYPGKASANPNKINSRSSELFIAKFSDINHHLKQLNLEKYLNDEKHLYIKSKSSLSTELNNTNENATRAYFANHQNSKKNEILEETNKNLSTYLIAIYATACHMIPKVTIATFCTDKQKRTDATAHNEHAKAQHNTWVARTLNNIPDHEKEAFADFHAQTLTDQIGTPQGGDP